MSDTLKKSAALAQPGAMGLTQILSDNDVAAVDEMRGLYQEIRKEIARIIIGQDEVIEFKHTAYSKAVFAKGAVEAAKFLKGKGAGHYDMADVIAAK